LINHLTDFLIKNYNQIRMSINKIKKERLTSQRKIILDYLKSTKTHPTAQEVYLVVKKILPQISRATVYRNLKMLIQKKEILEINSEVCHFDGNIFLHGHFVCQKCDKIFDINSLCRQCKVIKKNKIKIGKVQGCNIIFYGLCKKCQKK